VCSVNNHFIIYVKTIPPPPLFVRDRTIIQIFIRCISSCSPSSRSLITYNNIILSSLYNIIQNIPNYHNIIVETGRETFDCIIMYFVSDFFFLLLSFFALRVSGTDEFMKLEGNKNTRMNTISFKYKLFLQCIILLSGKKLHISRFY